MGKDSSGAAVAATDRGNEQKEWRPEGHCDHQKPRVLRRHEVNLGVERERCKPLFSFHSKLPFRADRPGKASKDGALYGLQREYHAFSIRELQNIRSNPTALPRSSALPARSPTRFPSAADARRARGASPARLAAARTGGNLR